MTSGAPKLLVDLTSPKNKTSHSTSGLANSFALDVDTSCTCEIVLFSQGDSSSLHSAVGSGADGGLLVMEVAVNGVIWMSNLPELGQKAPLSCDTVCSESVTSPL